MEWSNITERDPLVVWVPTVDLVRILKLNLRGLQEASNRNQVFQTERSIEDFLQEQQWIERRERNLVLLEACGERQHSMAMYPHGGE